MIAEFEEKLVREVNLFYNLEFLFKNYVSGRKAIIQEFVER